MKRLSIIAVAAIAALLSASCNKSIETPVVPVPQGSIILDLNISGFDGAGDTKAVKADWAAGDKLNLWFDDWNYTEKANNPTPDLVITYDGSKWTAGELAAGRSLRQAASSLSCMKAPITCPNIRLPSFRFRSSSGRIKNRMLEQVFISCL